MESNQKNLELLGYNLAQLEALAVKNGEQAFRGRQLYQWLYEKGICNLEDITVLPKSWRGLLIEQGFTVGCLNEINRSQSNDQTIKLLLETNSFRSSGVPLERIQSFKFFFFKLFKTSSTSGYGDKTL